MSNTYKSAGVDKEEGYKTVDKIKKAVGETHNANVLNHLGSFGAFYEIGGYKNPVLVSGTDGVGTKLKVALDTKNMILSVSIASPCVPTISFVTVLSLYSS